MGVLALGWSYIFSACLVEMQRLDGAAVLYTDFTAVGYDSGVKDPSSPTVPVYVGKMDACDARWSAAVLAPRQGWIATVSRLGNEVY